MAADTGPRRWSEAPTAETARAVALLRLAEPPPLPSDAELAQIEARLREAPARRSRLRWVAAAAAGCASASLAFAWLREPRPRTVEQPVPATVVPAPRVVSAVPPPAEERRMAMRPSSAAAVRSGEGAVRQLRASPSAGQRRHAAVLARADAPAPAAPTPWNRPDAPVPAVASPAAGGGTAEDPLELEARSLGVALTRLRRDGDAAGALRALASYRASYPEGSLRGEADAAEIEADLRLGHDAAALRLLDGLEGRGLDDMPRAQELRVLRAELLARAGRDAEALPAFDALEAAPLPPPLRERVLHGRAALLVRTGRAAASRTALAAYLREFPAGPFAAEARRALGGL